MTRLTITGASGYLGGAIAAKAALNPGFRVRCLTRRPDSSLPGERIVVDSLTEGAAGAVANSDTVIHLAAPNEVLAAADPDGSLCEAVAVARAVAAACAATQVKRLIFVSTVHVYGAALSPGALVDEATVPLPRSPYAVARLASEHMIAASAGATEVVVLRVSNAVGPPASPQVDRWSLVANDLCRRAAEGRPLTLRSDGGEWRDFIALDDVVDIVLAATVPGRFEPGTYNVATGQAITVLELAETISREADSLGLGPAVVELATRRTTGARDPFRIATDRVSRLGFTARTPISKALSDTIRFCLNQPHEVR